MAVGRFRLFAAGMRSGIKIACFQSVNGLNEDDRANRRHDKGME